MSIWKRLLGLDTLEAMEAEAAAKSTASDGETPGAEASVVTRAIAQGTPVRKLIPRHAGLLAKYCIADYIGSDRLQKCVVEGRLARMSARAYFAEHQVDFVTTIDGADVGRAYSFEIASTFIVIELAPNSVDTKMVVLTPVLEEPTGLRSFDAIAASHAIVALLSVLGSPVARFMLFEEADELLRKLSLT